MAKTLTTRDIERLENTSFASAFAAINAPMAVPDASGWPCALSPIGIEEITHRMTWLQCTGGGTDQETCGDSNTCISMEGACQSVQGVCNSINAECASQYGVCTDIGVCSNTDVCVGTSIVCGSIACEVSQDGCTNTCGCSATSCLETILEDGAKDAAAPYAAAGPLSLLELVRKS